MAREVLRENADDYFAHRDLGLALRKWSLEYGGENEIAGALEHLGAAARLLPKDLFTRKQLSDVLVLAGKEAEAKEVLAEAIDMARSVSGEASNSAVA